MNNNTNKDLIKTEVWLDNSGREFNTGRHRYSSAYMIPLSKEEALERFDRGEKVYFIYSDEHTMWIYNKKLCRKACKDRDYLIDHYDCYHEVCGIPMPLNHLTDDEYNILQLLSSKSHMDNWFCLIEKDDKDMIRDLEEEKIRSLKNALPDFVEGLTDVDLGWLSEEENEVFLRLVDRFGLNDVYKEIA